MAILTKKKWLLLLLGLALLMPGTGWSMDGLEWPADDAVLIDDNSGNKNLPPPQLRSFLRQLSRDPKNLTTALQTARLCILLAKRTGDSRYYGFAQGALSPWWQDPNPPAAVLPLRSRILQFRHQFKEARADLELYLTKNPEDHRASLDLAILDFVGGRYQQASKRCHNLMNNIPFAAVTCFAAANSMLGKQDEAGRSLSEALLDWPHQLTNERSWAEATQGEIMHRIGKFAQAEQHFRKALEILPGDSFSVASFADLLIELKRYQDVISLTENMTLDDSLQLRRLIGLIGVNHKDATKLVASVKQNLLETRRTGGIPHLREEAWFYMDVERNKALALERARENFKEQREPIDIWLFARAARESQNRAALDQLRLWIKDIGFKDRRVDALMLDPPL